MRTSNSVVACATARPRRRQCAFVLQQPPLAPDAACVPSEVTIAPNHAVARDHQARGVTRVRPTNRARPSRVPYDLGELSVGRRRTGRDCPECLPDLLLERSAAAVDSDAVERPNISREIGAHSSCVPVRITASLQDDAGESRADPRKHSRPRDREGECAKRIVSRDHCQRAERRPDLIDPEHRHAGSATHPDGRCVVSMAAPSSHKSMAA